MNFSGKFDEKYKLENFMNLMFLLGSSICYLTGIFLMSLFYL